jgi:hypothetical protein
MQENQQPYHRTWPSSGVACHEILQWEHSKDHLSHGDAGDEDPPHAKPPNDARGDGKLEDAVHAPEYRHPQTDRCWAEVESTKLDWRRPNERDERHSRQL